VCDGSADEADELTEKLVDRGLLVPLPKMDNCYACRTDPADVARVESKTYIVTDEKVGMQVNLLYVYMQSSCDVTYGRVQTVGFQ
jgi:GTP-dependent phosphoenolpyruvate carboxykinase